MRGLWGNRLMRFIKEKHYRNALLLLLTALVGFVIPLAGAINVLFLMEFPAFRSLLISAAFAALCSVVAIKFVEKKIAKAEENEKRKLRREREDDTQKQIDAMLRGSSKIPEVKR